MAADLLSKQVAMDEGLVYEIESLRQGNESADNAVQALGELGKRSFYAYDMPNQVVQLALRCPLSGWIDGAGVKLCETASKLGKRRQRRAGYRLRKRDAGHRAYQQTVKA